MEQKHSSANTSINQRKPAICGLVTLRKGQVVYDHGCGKYPQYMQDWVESQGCVYYGFDPYHGTAGQELRKFTLYGLNGADVTLLSNVLNVIDSREARAKCLQEAARYTRWGGCIYITVYEGDGSGVGRETRADCWQENRKTEDYMREVVEALPMTQVSRRGKLIVAKMTGWCVDRETGELAGRVVLR